MRLARCAVLYWCVVVHVMLTLIVLVAEELVTKVDNMRE